MSPVTANVPSILTELIKSMATAVTVTALSVTTADRNRHGAAGQGDGVAFGLPVVDQRAAIIESPHLHVVTVVWGRTCIAIKPRRWWIRGRPVGLPPDLPQPRSKASTGQRSYGRVWQWRSSRQILRRDRLFVVDADQQRARRLIGPRPCLLAEEHRLRPLHQPHGVAIQIRAGPVLRRALKLCGFHRQAPRLGA